MYYAIADVDFQDQEALKLIVVRSCRLRVPIILHKTE